ncbi:MAG: type I methionyl aminopeptidase [Planctomycetes bacterium]|nr:type I methionyl aminopeptidase [Planctomycetota bacterium]
MVTRKSRRELDRMREAGRIVGESLALADRVVAPGVTTKDIEREMVALIRRGGGEPCFLGYRGFPACICASVNEEVVHGIPDDRRLREGDIVGIDVGVRYKGYIADAARTFAVGRVEDRAQRLMDVCRESLEIALAAVGPDVRLSEIASRIQAHIEGAGYGVVRDYSGHGVGRQMHEDPQVPNYVDEHFRRNDMALKPGHVIAIEPMANEGTHLTSRVRKGNWDVVVTRDGKLSAHFEHTVAVLDEGSEVLTQKPGGGD